MPRWPMKTAGGAACFCPGPGVQDPAGGPMRGGHPLGPRIGGRLDQESHHFVHLWNVELRHGANLLEHLPHGLGGIEQLEPNIVILSPSLQKQEHSKTAAFDGIHLREVKHNDSCVCLQGDSFAQFEGSFALHNSAFALYDRQVTNVIDIDFQHDLLPVVCSVVMRACARHSCALCKIVVLALCPCTLSRASGLLRSKWAHCDNGKECLVEKTLRSVSRLNQSNRLSHLRVKAKGSPGGLFPTPMT